MTHDQLVIVAIAVAWSAGVGLLGILGSPLLRRATFRQRFAAVAVVAVLCFVSGVIGTANAMFLSSHDFHVVLLVSGVAGAVSIGFALLLADQVVRGTKAVGEAVLGLGDEGAYLAPASTPTAELTALSRQLEETSRKLVWSRERERSLEGSRRELVAWVSHDLRTPLAGLRAMAEALEDGLAPDPARYHKQIRVDVDRMSRMVDDLFELSRIHAGTLNLVAERVSLTDLISDALAAADPIARVKDIELTGSAAAALDVRGDGRELARAIGNLLNNAIEQSPRSSAVHVEAGRDEDSVVIRVTDRCGGIADDELDRVFDVAWRGTAARTPDSEVGAGLGLAIVRGIVEGHKGSVAVSNADGGCAFVVRLPAGVG